MKKVVINTSHDHVTSYRNGDCNCHDYFLLILLQVCLHTCVCVYICF